MHPTEIAYDFVTTRKTLDAIGNREGFGINLDPSHFAHQSLDTAQFALEFADRIYHVHVKDSIKRLDGRRSILGSHLNFGEEMRGWDFVSPGHGDVDFEALFRALNRIGYQGPLSIEWEDSGMEREYGAQDALAFVRQDRLRAVRARLRRGDAEGGRVSTPDRRGPARSSASGSTTRITRRSRASRHPSAPLFFAKYTTVADRPGRGDRDPAARHAVRLRGRARRRDRPLGARRLEGERARGRRAATSARTTSRRATSSSADGQWTRGKSPDTFCPVGPVLVPASEVPDPHDLRIRAIVSGEVLQDSTTANLIFGIDEIISYASQTSTLEAGDLILTGTPAGVGIFRDPKRLLEPGDTVTIEIEGLGELTNPVIAG